jgi:hypothetical protein
MKKHHFYKNRLLIVFIFLSVNAFSQPDSSFHIYLMFGQSNMEGAGTIEAQDRVTNPRVKVLQDLTCANLGRSYGQWYTAAPPLNRCWSGIGPGDSFGRMLGEKAPSNITIGLVNVSVGGCNIYIYKKGCPNGLDTWSQGIPFDCGYTWLLDLAKKAQEAGVIKGILFHQGETNNTDPNWKYTVQQIVKDLKTDLGLGDIPFLAGELLYSQYNSCCSAHNVEINKLPSLIPNAHVISAAGLPGADNAHFTSASYRLFGERYGKEMLKLIYNICDSTTTSPFYQVNNGPIHPGDSVLLNYGTQLVLSPGPSDLPGKWSWTGVGITGSTRQQTVNTNAYGTFNLVSVYTNECGVTSRLNYKVVVCDSSLIEPWYKTDEGVWINSSSAWVRKGTSLVLGPQPADGTGNWNWKGDRTTGASREQIINTSKSGSFDAKVSYTNSCGAVSNLTMSLKVCDSTTIQPYFMVNNSSWMLSDTIMVNAGDSLILGPYPPIGTGKWEWTGAGLSGNLREQKVNTSSPGTHTVGITFTNSCGIQSHITVTIIISESTGTKDHIPNINSIRLYPNPARNEITIKNNHNLENGVIRKYIITNTPGQVLLSENLQNTGYEHNINIGSLDAGIYFLKLIGTDFVIEKRFVKIR